MNRSQALNLLGIDSKATPKEIKEAYRKMAMKYHPDRNPDDNTAEAKFKEVKEAFEWLESGKQDPVRPSFTPRPGFADFSDLMREMDKFPLRMTATVKVSLKEAFEGCTKKIDLTQQTGVFETVVVPPGYRDGEVFAKFAGKRGDREYEIAVVLKIDVGNSTVVWPNEMWLYGGATEGSGNITTPLAVDWFTIMNGGFMTVTTLDGTTGTIRIPAGIEAGKMVKVAGKGYWCDAKMSRRGDQLYKIQPVIPKFQDIPLEQLQQFVDMAKERIEKPN